MVVLINGKQVLDISDPKHYSGLAPLYSNKLIDVGVDQSKTHSAIVVGAPSGGYIGYIEILGGGESTDVFDVCALTRRVCADLFRNANIRYVGVEDPITREYVTPEARAEAKARGVPIKHTYSGMDTHRNRLKLSAIFSNYMFLFYDITGKHPEAINNNDWKVGVLPTEYRKKTHKKGSLDYHNDIHSVFAGTNDNVTDAACILDYIRQKHREENILEEVSGIELPSMSFDWRLIDFTQASSKGGYLYNPKLTWRDNITFAGNRSSADKVGILVVPIACVPIEELYSERCLLQKAECDKIIAVVGAG